METTQFPCSHCGKLMAVMPEFLGKQVRCPHCQQVLVANVPSSPTPSPEPILPPAPEDPESIFSETQPDDLFGELPGPTAEMPPGPGPFPESTPGGNSAAPPSGQGGLSSVTVSYEPNPPEPHTEAAEAPVEAVENPWPEPAAPGSDWESSPPAPQPQPPGPPVRAGSPLATLALTIVVPYALLMTAIAGYLYFNPRSTTAGTSPLEMLPDEGLNPGVRRVLHGKRSAAEEAALPDRLRVCLGQLLRVGDLEVTPLEVALRPVSIHTANFIPSQERALVLKLHLKNVSTLVAFHPVDPFFDRSWKPDDPNGKPYTRLEVGGQGFFGGPIDWENALPRRDNPRQFIPEQHQDRELRPGQEMDTIVCTNPHDPVEKALASYHGPLLWRVQLRRGLVEVRNHDASATAVIGVAFQDSDIRREEKN